MHDFVYSALPSLNEFQLRWEPQDVCLDYLIFLYTLYTTAVLKHTHSSTYSWDMYYSLKQRCQTLLLEWVLQNCTLL